MNTLTIAIIDNDYIDRLISKKLIVRICPDVEIIEFSSALDALEYFSNNARNEDMLPDIVILDMRMSEMSGREYLGHFSKIEGNMIKHPQHYIYTSSINPTDLNYQHKNIKGVYTKPFTNLSLRKIIGPDCERVKLRITA